MSSLPKKCLALNTRPVAQAQELGEVLAAAGFEVVDLPCLEIGPEPGLEELLGGLFENDASPDWLVITSANGVRTLSAAKFDWDFVLSRGVKIAVIGSKTKEALESVGVEPHFSPETQNSDGFALEFPKLFSFDQDPVRLCLLRGNLANKGLVLKLEEQGFEVEDRTVYRSSVPGIGNSEITNILDKLSEDQAILFILSGESAKNLKDYSTRVGLWPKISKVPAIVVGPVTQQRTEELGFSVQVVAEKPDIRAMVIGAKDWIGKELK